VSGGVVSGCWVMAQVEFPQTLFRLFEIIPNGAVFVVGATVR